MTKLLEAIMGANEKDLAELDAKITEHMRQLEAMRTTRKVIADRLGIEGPKRASAKRASADGESGGGAKSAKEASALANQIYDLLHVEGSMPLPAIAARLGTVPQAIARAISANACATWFKKANSEVSIAVGP